MNEPILSNIAEGTHAGNVTRTLEAVTTERYQVARQGSAAKGLLLGNTSAIPIGIITDEGTIGDSVNLALLGSASSSLLAVAGGTINAGDYIVSAASGRVGSLPSGSGTFYILGQALSDAASGQLVEFDPCVPVQRVVS
ncbi:MAG: capsid cement protein [Opitutales bacterium]